MMPMKQQGKSRRNKLNLSDNEDFISNKRRFSRDKIANRFGEAPYYLIYDSETKKTEARVNPGHDDNNHSAVINLKNEGVFTLHRWKYRTQCL